MKLSGFGDLYGNLNSHPAAPSYGPPHGRYVAGKIGHSQKWAKTGQNYPKISTFVELVCLVGAHTGPRSGG